MKSYFNYGFGLLVLAGLLGPALCAVAEPKTKAGPYEIRVIGISRQIDLTPPEPAAATALTLTVTAPPEALDKLLEAAREPEATDDLGNRLIFQEIRIPEYSGSGLSFQILLSPAAAESTRLKQFRSHLVCFDKKTDLRLDFLCVAGEKLAGRNLEYLVINPELIGLQEIVKGKGKVYLVKAEVQFTGQKPDPAISWRNEAVELIDAEGRPRGALSTSRSFKYDNKGQMTAIVITAAFPPPAQSPRGLRYRVEKLQGVQAFDYVFENLPLP